MAYVLGQTIRQVVTILDSNSDGILGLVEGDFTTLESFSVTTPATTAVVSVDELDEGQYVLEFVPSLFGDWALHYLYEEPGVRREETFQYGVASTAEITVVTSGGVWTYTGDLTDPSQEVRFLIQDTDSTSPLFSDTEVAYALGSAQSNVRRAAASLVERLMARYAALADTTELDLSVKASQMYEQYKLLHATLSNPFGGGDSVTPYAGGISVSDMEANVRNTDRVPGIFDKGYSARRSDWGGIR